MNKFDADFGIMSNYKYLKIKSESHNIKLNILCEIGIHKWKKAGDIVYFSSNVKEKHYVCTICGERKNKVMSK